MLPTKHPLNKTAIDLRRSIGRLNVYKEQNPNDPYVLNGSVDEIIEDLQNANRHIPKELIDNEA
jgi:hypothetical protein